MTAYPVAAPISQWNLPAYLPYPTVAQNNFNPLEVIPDGQRYPLAETNITLKGTWRWLYLGSGCHKSDSTLCKIVNWFFGYTKQELESDSQPASLLTRSSQSPRNYGDPIETFKGKPQDELCTGNFRFSFPYCTLEEMGNYTIENGSECIVQKNYVVIDNIEGRRDDTYAYFDPRVPRDSIFAMRIAVQAKHYISDTDDGYYPHEQVRCIFNALNAIDPSAHILRSEKNITSMACFDYNYEDCFKAKVDYGIPILCDPRVQTEEYESYYLFLDPYVNDGDERLFTTYYGNYRFMIRFYTYDLYRDSPSSLGKPFKSIWNVRCNTLIKYLIEDALFKSSCWDHTYQVPFAIDELTCYDPAHFSTTGTSPSSTGTSPTTEGNPSTPVVHMEKWKRVTLIVANIMLNTIPVLVYVSTFRVWRELPRV